MPIAMKALELSTGKTSKELFKLMEAGELGKDRIVPFMKAMGELANKNGALEAALKTSRTAQNRFNTTLQFAEDTIFKGEFNKNYADLLNNMADATNDSTFGLKGLGKIFALVFRIIDLGARIVVPVLDSMFFIIGKVAEGWNLIFGTNSGELVAGIGRVTAALVALNKVANGIGWKFLFIFGVLDEIFSLFTKGRVSMWEDLLGIDISTEGITKIKGGGDLQNQIKKNYGVDPFEIFTGDIATGLFNTVSKLFPLVNAASLVAGAASGQSNKNVTINQNLTVQNPPGADAEHTKRLVGEELEKHNQIVTNILKNDMIGAP